MGVRHGFAERFPFSRRNLCLEIVDQTGLTGRYDFTLNWTPDESQFAVLGGYHAPAQEDPNAPPSLSTAIQEQLGLKLENTKAKVDTFVIDHLEKPTAN